MSNKVRRDSPDAESQSVSHPAEHIHAHAHVHAHPHADSQGHLHEHAQVIHERYSPCKAADTKILTIRPHSGLSGDILLAGLAVLCLKAAHVAPDSRQGEEWLQNELGKILPALAGGVRLAPKMVQGIAGWHAYVDLPEEHRHRNLADIEAIIAGAELLPEARVLALNCFKLLAECEAQAHGITAQQVHFHEVGALDSILDICGTALFYNLLGAPHIVCGALPIADGSVFCQHGVLPAPAPAVLSLLKGLTVRSFAGSGETLTPTAAALLKSLPVEFGAWPKMRIEDTALVYGNKTFPDVSNGATFAIGFTQAEYGA